MRKPLAAIILFYPQSKLYLENSICVISQMRKTKHSVVLRPLPKATDNYVVWGHLCVCVCVRVYLWIQISSLSKDVILN